MKWSLKLGSFAGIRVYVHWTFVLLLGWILFSYVGQGHDWAEAWRGVGFIVALFGCVLLHEFGHALTAKHYDIRTKDITLLPIGGIARLERLPDNPRHELWVTLAGPAVNVVIAGVLFAALVFAHQANEFLQVRLLEGNFLMRLMWVNVFLGAFNLLPAFPMDGGRVLRALLSMRLGRARATRLAASIGQSMAILFGIAGFFGNPMLIFIAIFVYLGAEAEARAVETTSFIGGLQVKDGMMTRFRSFAEEDTLESAIRELLAGSQQDFPVVADGNVAGILRRSDLVQALAQGRREASVADVMSRNCGSVLASDPLDKTLERMSQEGCATLTVMDGGKLAGLLTLENIGELVMVKSAVAKGAERDSRKY
jgi:Zn-dependent protease/predicted transcriptional regulator